MIGRAPTPAVCVVVVLVLAGCGSTHHRKAPAPPSGPAAQRLAGLRAALPGGFTAPGNGPSPPATVDLKVTPAAGMKAADVHVAPAPSGDKLRSALATVVIDPVAAVVRPLFVSTATVHPGDRIAVAAAHLAPGSAHAVLFILQGPGYRAEHLVEVARQIAAGYVQLPAVMKAGAWYLAAEDLSALRPGPQRKLTGTALIDIVELTLQP